ncbi:glycosyltransferase family 4 protein [Aliidiomarina halalkaliphila]|uniref:Glycosyltransferase family 4 protein n=1 Tax=Aliidiomarina halalkaliphila TaxID=2593535 RepID=A0A552X594_9GAMM|nr:glycosyltransferase [Aliidiomarina halalkaliphila]TRW50192.1 glycosyltransferase family 4 protein [Aliidiomarina halalkaliphila]
MHILVLPSWYKRLDYPNSASFVSEQTQILRSYGLEVGIISINQIPLKHLIRFYKEGHKVTDSFSEDGIYNIKFNLPKIPILSFMLRQLMIIILFNRYVRKKGMPDIIHAHSFFDSGLTSLYFKKCRRIPIVLTEHFSGFLTDTIPWYKLRLFKRLSRYFDASIAVSERFAKKLNWLLEENRFQCVPNVIPPIFENFDGFEVGDKPYNSFVFLSVGALTKNKNHSLLIRSFHNSFEGNRAVKLRIIGKGPEYNNLKILIKKLKLEDQVTLLGEMNRFEVLMQMHQSDVFVLPSKFETFGVVVIEAFACGLPVIATRCVGPEELIEDSNGILVQNDSIDSLTNGLNRIYKETPMYCPVSIRENCIAKFGRHSFFLRINRVYNAVSGKLN